MKQLLYLFILLGLTGCQFNSKRINDESDIANAELITNEFYKKVKSQNYTGIQSTLHSELLKETSSEEFIDLLKKFKAILGNLKKVKKVKSSSEVMVGTNPQAMFQLVFENQYDDFIATETITLKGETLSGGIRIIGYHVNSEAFLE